MGRPVIRRLLAYAAVYLFWGASFLAIREIVLVAPPFLAAAVRFLIAGSILIVWSRAIRAPWPNAAELRSTAMLGVVMFSINYGLLFWGERIVPSGYAALFAATVPFWVFLGEWLWLGTQKPTGRAFLAVGVGIVGVTLLVLPHGESANWTLPAIGQLVGAFCWALGTIWSRRLPMPQSRHASAGLQMFIGGVGLLAFSAAVGEISQAPAVLSRWNVRLTVDLAYLIACASIAAFFAYVWLIEHEPASRVATNTFVNPLIAVALGASIAGERFAAIQIAGAALILASVVLTHTVRRARSAAA